MNGILIEHNCRVCKEMLTDDNWYPSRQKKRDYICKVCHNEKSCLRQATNRDEVNTYQRLYRAANRDEMNAKQRSYRKNNPEKTKADYTRSQRKRGVLPMSENKECSMYLGVHVNERLLKHYFDDVEVMPYSNPGYDFVCNKGWKIDAKSSCLHKNGGWSFTIKRNTKADYFFCVAYDNRKDLNIIHIWLLPGEKFNHRSGVSISPSALDKWDKYEQPLDKVIKCCDSMKAQATCEMRYSIDEIWDEADAYISIEASADEKSL